MQQQSRRPVTPRPAAAHRTAAAWLGLAFVAGGSCAIAPQAIAAAPSCARGQMAATRFDYEGKYNPAPTTDIPNSFGFALDVGYTRRTVIVADGYFKEVSEGTIAVVKTKPPGKPIPIDNSLTFYVRELPSRLVSIETPQQEFFYDEQGDPDQLGKRRTKAKHIPAEEERAIVGGLQAALAPAADRVKILGKATYAGVSCEMRQFLMSGWSTCVARLHNQYVTLAVDMRIPDRERSWMEAKTKADVCVSPREFEPPAHVRFK